VREHRATYQRPAALQQGLAIFRDERGRGVANTSRPGTLASEERTRQRPRAFCREPANQPAARRKWILAGSEEWRAPAGGAGSGAPIAPGRDALRQRIAAALSPIEKVELDADLDPARRGLPGARPLPLDARVGDVGGLANDYGWRGVSFG